MQSVTADISNSGTLSCQFTAEPDFCSQGPQAARPENQEQLRRWLEALGVQIQQLGVDAGSLRNRLASMQGMYISRSPLRDTSPETIADDQKFAGLVLRLLQQVRDQYKA